VVRIWFDKQLNASTPDIIETPDYGVINLIAQYSKLEAEFIDWANQTGGSVLEFHCYTWTKNFPANVTDDEIWTLISPTVQRILPELFDRKFNILAYHVNTFQNFGSFQHGSIKYRPNVEIFSENSIYLAGDWIRTAYPAALMEKAVSTGREAANAILLKDHIRQASLLVTNSRGPGIL
jgi:isorenieratene synthase